MAARDALILAAALSSACAREAPRPAVSGDVVTLHYTLKAGAAFIDSTETKGAATVVLGRGGLIPGLARGVVGMRAGEERAFNIAPEDAFGLYESSSVPWSGRVISARVKVLEVRGP